MGVCACMQALEEMQAAGHRPDAGVYNCVIEALTSSGVLAAQLKAAQLFLGGARSGQLRPVPQGGSDLAVLASTVGAALLAVLQWLVDLRCARPISALGRSPGAAARCVCTSLCRGWSMRRDRACRPMGAQ